MQVNLDDGTNINVEKTEAGDEFVLCVDDRTRMYFSRSELKFIQALIDSALKEDEVMSRESLQDSLINAVETQKPQLQLILRNMKTEDMAYAVWYIADKKFTEAVLGNISRRSSEDVQEIVRESIERRIRKERAEGNRDIENVLKEQGRHAAAGMLRKILSA
ncbi:hypothetical protein ACMC5R_13565 [Deferribacteres bacterium DY0037]